MRDNGVNATVFMVSGLAGGVTSGILKTEKIKTKC
jgi:hypothetical protein